jgi:hypothetical protein
MGALVRRKIDVSGDVGRHMDYDDYLREQATKYRELATDARDPMIKAELAELAQICDEIANNIEDRATAG